MRLRTKFILLLSFTVILSVTLIAVILSRLARADATAYITDIQSNNVLSGERQLFTRMDVLYNELSSLLRIKTLPLDKSLAQLPGVLAGEVWKSNRRVSAFPLITRTDPPPAGKSEWSLQPSSEQEKADSVRWIGRFNETTVVLTLSQDWFGDVLHSNHGTTSELLDAAGFVLLRNGAQGKIHGREFFHGIETVQKIPPTKSPYSISYQAADAKLFFGTFLRLSTDPPLILAVHSPTASIKKVTNRVYTYAFLAGSLILVFAILGGAFFAHHLANPLEVLAHRAESIGKGHLSEPLPAERSDEIGHLAAVFNQMNKDLLGTREALRKSERLAAFGLLSAAITHEIKSPLGMLLSGMQMINRKFGLAKEELDLNDLRGRTKAIEHEILRLNTKLIQLMKYVRQTNPPTRAISLAERLRKSIEILRPDLEKAHVVLELHICQDEALCKANGDEIHEVILNLIGNAQHAMKGLENRKLKIRLDTTEAEAFLSVEDNGCGMTTEIRERIFEPFYTTKDIGEGTGLGLAVVYGIIANHGGAIRVESEPRRFTRFLITLPLAAELQRTG